MTGSDVALITRDDYTFLDRQLADLLLRLCNESGYALSSAQKELLAGWISRVSAATRNGMIALPLSELTSMPEPASDTLISPGDLAVLRQSPVIGDAGDYAPLIIEDGHIWLNRYWQYEQRLATALQERLQTLALSHQQCSDIQQQLQYWYPSGTPAADKPDTDNTSSSETDWQQQAVAMAACSLFQIISGGPGTGKTTTVIRLLWLLIEQIQIKPQRILLAAPTGKAAMRLQESIRQAKTALKIPAEFAARIPDQAQTLHRLLGYIPGKVSFRHHLHNPLPADVVIVDEASMIDISLMTQLFEAVPAQARLILLGDRDQLAAVETGSVFRDLCTQADNRYSDQRRLQLDYLCSGSDSESAIPIGFQQATPQALHDHIVTLQKSWRFPASSGIGQLAAAIRDGATAKLRMLLQTDWPDVYHNESATLDMAGLGTAWQGYLQYIQSGTDSTQLTPDNLEAVFTAFNCFRILSPLRKGPSGTEQLNQQISRYIHHHYSPTPPGNSPWFIGRPVMVTQNDYRQNLFNGDIGITLMDAQGELRVWFQEPDGFRAITPVRLPVHETAWAMTIHKSQGSEFDEVLLVLPDNEDIPLLGRELLYTGITRARQKITLQGKRAIILHAMQQTLPPSSRICQRLVNTNGTTAQEK